MTERQICQQAFFPFLLLIVANQMIKDREIFFEKAEKVFKELLENQDKSKLFRRLDRLMNLIFDEIVDKRDDTVNTHKLILVLHGLAVILLSKGFHFLPEVEEVFEEFLAEEEKHQCSVDGKEITAEGWVLAKKSAQKIAERLMPKINNNLEFFKDI